MTGLERSWGMFPAWLAVLAAYVWLGLAAWVLAAPRNSAPELVKAACVGCWLAVGIWVWERTDQVNAEHGAGSLLFRFAFTVAMGAVAMCLVPFVAIWRWLR